MNGVSSRSIQRREFVRTGACAALTAAGPMLWSARARRIERLIAKGRPALSPPATTLYDPHAHVLALQAIDAARSAGARYADVRVTNTIRLSVGADDPVHFSKDPSRSVALGVSVRALVNGSWGWAATPTLSTAEVVRVARLAVTLARLTEAHNILRSVELAPTPVVSNGTWASPVTIDPFTLDLLEIEEWLYGASKHIMDLGVAKGGETSIRQFDVTFERQERLFASTDGTLLTQTVTATTPMFVINYRGVNLTIPYFNQAFPAGWERVANTPIIDLFLTEMEQLDAAPSPSIVKPLDLGRYDVVLGVAAVAQVLAQTFGTAAQVDRALGYWANTDGTSYLGPDPLNVLGTTVASPLVTVTAERSNPRGLATAKWDDEGVATADFPLVNDGELVDYQTTREQAPWLAPWYQKRGEPVRSHGCAMAPSALEEPLQHTPNLVLHPGVGSTAEETLIGELEHGIHVPVFAGITMDWQSLNGVALIASGTEIRNGKSIARVGGRAIMLDALAFWKNVEALGGPASAVYGRVPGSLQDAMSTKGVPAQSTSYSVGVVPARIRQLAVVDPARRV